jgi:hypothetical protein
VEEIFRGPKFIFADLAAASILLLMGIVFFSIGRLRPKNRLLIHEHGIAQIKWTEVDAILWPDVRQVRCERETRYGSGLAYNVRYHCSLGRSDGTWLTLNAIPITSQVMKALGQCPGFSRLGG